MDSLHKVESKPNTRRRYPLASSVHANHPLSATSDPVLHRFARLAYLSDSDMNIRPRTILTGALSFVPGVMPLYRRFVFRPHSAPAETSYGIWLKHLSAAHASGLVGVPASVVELGPGLSLGAGMAALICGVERYVALDVLPFAQMEEVLPTFDRLVELFKARAALNPQGFPYYPGALDTSGWPSILPHEHLEPLLRERRIAELRKEVEAFVGGGSSKRIAYQAPWGMDAATARSADFVFSHTVLQHVRSVPEVWGQIAEMLRPGGISTHQIHFYNHGTSPVWNGHWAYPEWLWRLALGRKEFLINREPISSHLDAARAAGLGSVDIRIDNAVPTRCSGWRRDATAASR
ncbi:MAG: hypothetical protein E6Q92_10305 [Burkholderiaceae bacterium]|nr:MAG: hypothetical protein E6Q92_10305 [Burkholderiaceae bacterium]